MSTSGRPQRFRLSQESSSFTRFRKPTRFPSLGKRRTQRTTPSGFTSLRASLSENVGRTALRGGGDARRSSRADVASRSGGIESGSQCTISSRDFPITIRVADRRRLGSHTTSRPCADDRVAEHFRPKRCSTAVLQECAPPLASVATNPTRSPRLRPALCRYASVIVIVSSASASMPAAWRAC